MYRIILENEEISWPKMSLDSYFLIRKQLNLTLEIIRY